MPTYAIAYRDRHGKERPPVSDTRYSSRKKAADEAKRLNDAVRIKGNGAYVVVEV